MNRNSRILFLLLACLLIALSSFGQNYEKVLKEQQTLREQTTKLEHDSVDIASSLAKVQAASARLKTDIEALRKEQKELEAGSSEEALAAKEKAVGELRAESDRLARQFGEMTNSKQAKTRQIAEAKSRASELNVFGGELAKQDYEACKTMLAKPYSQLSMEKLQDMKASAEQYRSMAGFADYSKRLDAAIANKSLFDGVNSAINRNTPYNDVISLRKRLVAILQTKKDNPAKGLYAMKGRQYSEMDTLDIHLSCYIEGMKSLQAIVNSVNNDAEVRKLRTAKTSGSEIACKEAMRKHLELSDKIELQRLSKTYFSHVPYLDRLFRKYKSELSRNPLVETKVEKEILGYKTKYVYD